jgi:hypothetical protein
MKKVSMLLCAGVLMSALCAAFTACNDDSGNGRDESFPRNIVSRETLPEWIIDKVNDLESGNKGSYISVAKGEWKGRIVYRLYSTFDSCLYCGVYFEGDEHINWGENGNDFGDFETNSKNWVLIWDNGKEEISTRSEFFDDGKQAEDEYLFPQLSTEWGPDETVQSRLDVLQVPESMLATISTTGLLETCLNFPYLTDIFFYNDFQQGFEELSAEFNGFRELVKRPDLADAMLTKYNRMGGEVAEIKSRSNVEIGRFSIQHFVLEMTLAQDVVLKNLNEEQEKHLIAMSVEHTKIERSNPDVFGNLNAVPTSLLYAKKIVNASDASVEKKAVSANLIKAPLHVDQETMKHLEDFVITKYK